MQGVMAALSTAVLILAASPSLGSSPSPGASVPGVVPAVGSFGAPQHILDPGSSGIDMAVADDGHVHLVAADNEAVWYATDSTGAWTVQQVMGDAPGGGQAWTSPSIALDGDERVHIAALRLVCNDCSPSEENQRWSYGIHYVTDSGREQGTFPATPERLTFMGASPSLAAHGSSVMLAYQTTPRSGEGALMLLRRTGDGWRQSRIAPQGGEPSLAISAAGKPRVAFVSPRGLRYARARTTTGDWVLEPITRTAFVDNDPDLAIDAQGGAHVGTIDWGHMDIRYARRTADGWTDPTVITRGSAHALDVERPARPWLLAGAHDGVRAFTRTAAGFVSEAVSGDGVTEGHTVAVDVLPSGSVVAAWYGSDGVWISRS